MAVRQAKVGAVRLLLERGANVNQFSTMGYTALRDAINTVGQIEHQHFCPVRHLDLAAGKKAFDEIVALIQAQKPDPNFRNEDGETVLMVGAKTGNISVTEATDVNLQRADGMTALMLAIVTQPKAAPRNGPGSVYHIGKDGKPGPGYSARAYFVKTLVERGADLTVRNQAGKTALELARENGNPEILEVLEKAGEKK
jgi:ankyrin repeat protein